jgi:heptosyltransferase II
VLLNSITRFILYAQHALLGALSTLLFKQRRIVSSPQTILVFRTCLLGDFLFTLPGLSALRKAHPKARLVFLTAALPAQTALRQAATYVNLGEPHPWVSLVKEGIIDDYLVVRSLRGAALREVRQRIKSLNVDWTVLLTHPTEPLGGLVKKLLFLRLVGIKSPVFGWRVEANHTILKHAQFRMGLFKHHVYGPIRAISELPGMPAPGRIGVHFPMAQDTDAQARITAFWQSNSLEEYDVVALALGATQSHKQWPIEKFIELCKRLEGHGKHLAFVVLGTKDHRELGDRLALGTNQPIINLAGETSLQDLAEILRRANVLVGNDGGAMHLGASVGCPTVSLIPGIEYNGAVDPWGYEALSVRWPTSCAPCYSSTHCPLGHARCMRDIPVQLVLDKCILALNTFGARTISATRD